MSASEAPAAAAAPTTPFVTDLARLARAPFAPGDVFGEQAEQPTFWRPWLLVSVAYIGIQFLLRPFQARVGAAMAEAAGRPARAPGSAGAILGFVTGPLTVLIICAIAAGLLYVIAASFGGTTTYKKMLAVSIFAFPIFLLTQLVTWVVLTMRGVESINGPADMIVSMGLDNFLPSDMQAGYFLRFMLAGVGPLQIWSVAITAVGVGVMAKLARGSAWTVAILQYLIILAATSGLGAFGMKMLERAQ